MKNKTKKQLRDDVTEILVTTLSKLQDGMSKRKFTRNVKKASKVLLTDFNISKAKTVQESQPAEDQ